MAVGVAGEKKRYLCPECKSDRIRLQFPSPLGSRGELKLKITVEEIEEEIESDE